MVQEAAKRLAGKLAVVTINTDENRAIADRFAIRGIPAVHLLRGGKSVASFSGALDLEGLISWVRRNLA